MNKSNGLILWEGPSALDGAPIVVIITGIQRKSTNSKTGDMLQTYILRQSMHPVEAVKAGLDVSICGDCKHRGNGDGNARTCYVTVHHGPAAVWRTYRRGGYPRLTDTGANRLLNACTGRRIRFGAYGDPAAAPLALWEGLAAIAGGFTGYTHQWRENPAFASVCMASADSLEEKNQAQELGFRTFRVVVEHDTNPAPQREALCPASAEAGRKLQCADCMACCGTNLGKRRQIGGIVINQH